MDNVVKRPEFKAKYDNYIGGNFVAPIGGQYFDVVSPIDGKVFTRAAHSTKVDIDLAVDKAHEAFQTWGKTSVTERSNLLNKIAIYYHLLISFSFLNVSSSSLSLPEDWDALG